MSTSSLRAAVLTFVAVLTLSTAVIAGSETPPAGPPWKREFNAAQTEAAQKGLPIFVYLTKTY
jgi:hypothetical protein